MNTRAKSDDRKASLAKERWDLKLRQKSERDIAKTSPANETQGRRTCVMLLDFQNEFTKPGGKLHENVADMMQQHRLLEKVPQLVKTAREKGALIIHSPVIMKAGVRFKDADFDPHAYASMDGLFLEDTWNSQFSDEIQPLVGEEILRGRNDFCAFQGTELISILTRNKIDTLVICGFLSNVCVEETASAAKEKFPGMEIIVCSDGCAAKTKEEHENAMEMSLPVLDCKVMSCSDAEMLVSVEQVAPGKISNEEGSHNRNRLPRILALHGARSNDDVTKLQLENLGITDDKYDIVYLHGGVEVEEGDPAIAGLIRGPYYSWFEDKNEKDGGNLRQSIITGVRGIIKVSETLGPFDGVYGFSSGAAMAALSACINADPSLRAAIKALDDEVSETGRMASILARGFSGRKYEPRPSEMGKSIFGGLAMNSKGKKDRSIETGDMIDPPFKFVILANTATPFSGVHELRRIAGLPVTNSLDLNSFNIPSFHIIGIEDQFKTQSEEFASFFANRKVMYIPNGHAISREQRKDKELLNQIDTFARSYGQPIKKVAEAHFKAISEVSNIALLPHVQVALVKLNKENLPYSKGDGSTIISRLEIWPADRPFLRDSRVGDSNKYTTYGDALKFIQGGKGDLRRLGVKPGEVVAYGAPGGGGAVPALAFLSIGAQTAAAPLAPGTTEPDTLDALDQFQAVHLILFDGVKCPGVEAAFLQYADAGKAKLHRAKFSDSDKPGIFEFLNDDGLNGKPLTNPEKGICLLLRTSGTTARPKGVPLFQDALVNNGAILAAHMQLRDTDVCYSVMPLFHIGGISASILCTLASGGSVCCDSESYDPSRMVDALALSRPQPTWYSSVPTIHNATVAFIKDSASSDPKYKSYGIDASGVWKTGHSLRMIRSGAAALLGPDGDSLTATYGGVPIYPTYSMSEQMPISQPPAGKGNCLTDKKGSVGVPVAASTAIVSRSTLRPVDHGEEGEIAISGPTVLKSYLKNPDADRKAYFDLTLDIGSEIIGDITNGGRYFLTGDVGTIDSDGFLSLKGRAKELIKKGGEQVSPFEVEEPLLTHPFVKTPICFSVPSKLYGEEVGCALVLSMQAPPDASQKEIISAMRAWLKEAKLAPVKWPTKWIIVNDEDLPKTKTKKYIRVGLSTILGLDPEEETNTKSTSKVSDKAVIDWSCLGGLRFILACYVMFMHLGSTDSWGRMNHLRGFPWHVHLFFTLGGYSMASPMNPVIKKKFGYFKARIWAMYPMYAIAIFAGLINLLVVCRPSTFDPDFTYNSQPDDLTRGFFCQGTPATPKSYWGSLVLTIITYIFGLAVTPTFLITWWLGYYLWFSSMYYQCLAFFPGVYNALFNRTRKKTRLLLQIIIALLVLNIAVLVGFWFIFKDATPYPKDRDDTVAYETAKNWNIGISSYYLFGPFWALYFVIGAATAFLYDAYRPTERHNAWIWGLVADGCTLVMLGFSIAHICQGKSNYYYNKDYELYMRPDDANAWTDTAATNRIWDASYARLFCPLTTLWMFAISSGRGFTCKFLRQKTLSETLSPHSYNCFLFHQMVAQWYFAATRPGSFWNWWQYRKTMYWFSPGPCPVEWYEYFLIVGLVIAWSNLMFIVEPALSEVFEWVARLGKNQGIEDEEEEETSKVLMQIIEGMTGIEPELDYTLEECGLASIGVPALVTLMNKNFSKGKRQVTIAAANLVSAETIGDMVEVIDTAKELAQHQGI